MAIRFRYEDIDLGKPLEGLIYEKRNQIAYITINRPDKGNSLTKKMEQIFRAIWAEVREDPEIRVAIVTAAGERHFSTGFDVSSVDESVSVDNNLPILQDFLWSPRHNDVWKPTICVVNGLAVGA